MPPRRTEASATSSRGSPPGADAHREAALALLRPDPRVADALRLLPSPARPTVAYWAARAKVLSQLLPAGPPPEAPGPAPLAQRHQAKPERPDDWCLMLHPRWIELRAGALALDPGLTPADVDKVGSWRGCDPPGEPDALFVAAFARAARNARDRATAR